MKKILFILFPFILLAGCKKDNGSSIQELCEKRVKEYYTEKNVLPEESLVLSFKSYKQINISHEKFQKEYLNTLSNSQKTFSAVIKTIEESLICNNEYHDAGYTTPCEEAIANVKEQAKLSEDQMSQDAAKYTPVNYKIEYEHDFVFDDEDEFEFILKNIAYLNADFEVMLITQSED